MSHACGYVITIYKTGGRDNLLGSARKIFEHFRKRLQEPCGQINSTLAHTDVVQVKISEIIQNAEWGYWIFSIRISLSAHNPAAINVVNEGVNNKVN